MYREGLVLTDCLLVLFVVRISGCRISVLQHIVLISLDLPANADPRQRTQLVNDRRSPATLPYERGRIAISHTGHGS